MIRKALCVGIDYYQYQNNLHGCVNDSCLVSNTLSRNDDGTPNFSVKQLTAISEETQITRSDLKMNIRKLFQDESDN